MVRFTLKEYQNPHAESYAGGPFPAEMTTAFLLDAAIMSAWDKTIFSIVAVDGKVQAGVRLEAWVDG